MCECVYSSHSPIGPQPYPVCAEPDLLGYGQIETEVNFLEAMADDDTEKLQPKRTYFGLNHHFYELVWVWKYTNSYVSRDGRCHQ